MFTNYFPQGFFFNSEFPLMNFFNLSAIQFVNISLVFWNPEKILADIR